MMSKKSNKTSHVLNLITNRTGITPEDLEHPEVEQPMPGQVAMAAVEPPVPAPSIEDKIEKEAASNVERQVSNTIEQEVSKAAAQEIEQKISEKISDTVSEQIRANLEKVAAQEAEVRAKEAERRVREAEMRAREATEKAVEEQARPSTAAKKQAALQAAFPSLEQISAEIEKEQSVQPMPPPIPEAAPKISDAPKTTPDEPKPAAASAPVTNTEPATKAVPVSEDPMDGMVLANILEEVIKLQAKTVMEGFDMCTCDRCLNDVMAIALNSMPSRYAVTKKGALFAKVSSYGFQYKTDLVSVITKACMRVKESPSHS